MARTVPQGVAFRTASLRALGSPTLDPDPGMTSPDPGPYDRHMTRSAPDSPATDRASFGASLSAALRIRGISQRGLADLVGLTAQSSVSAWTRGGAAPAPEVVFEIERLLELPPGHLSQHLGFVPVGTTVPTSVPDAIESDPLLEPVHRQALHALYREFTVGQSGRS